MIEECTGSEAGLSGDAQVEIAVKEIFRLGGKAEMKQLYSALEKEMGGKQLSEQGRASFRFYVNKIAVKAGLIYPHDKTNPGWFLTPSGKEFTQKGRVDEITVNTDTNEEEVSVSNSARGLAFEHYSLDLIKNIISKLCMASSRTSQNVRTGS